MAGTDRLIQHPKRTLSALALGLCAVGVAVGSGADFAAETANPGNTFAAGSLTMDNSRDGAAIFSPTNMKPGGAPQTGTVDIENTGSIAGVFSLSRVRLASTDTGAPNPSPFASKVNVRVIDCGEFKSVPGPYGLVDVTPACGDGDDAPVYDGTLAGEDGAAPLGTFDAGEKHRYQFAGSLDASAGNEYVGDGSSARYVFDAVQGS